MSDFKLTADGDIDLTNFDFSLVTTSTDEIAQRILIKLKTYKGELFYNTEFGIPYHQEILGKQRDISIVESLIKEAIITVVGVKRLLEFAMDYVPAPRTLTVSFTVQLFTDEELTLNGVTL